MVEGLAVAGGMIVKFSRISSFLYPGCLRIHKK